MERSQSARRRPRSTAARRDGAATGSSVEQAVDEAVDGPMGDSAGEPANDPVDESAIERGTAAILDLVSRVPVTQEPMSEQPAQRAAELAAGAQRRTAALSAVAALPPGPIGWLTLLPEAVAVWRVQSRMVADIAGAHGQADRLSSELMLHCLFRHSAGQAVGGLAVRAGERLLVRHASYRALQPVARAVAGRMARRVLARGLARWVPGVGSAAIAVYAWRDTAQVARTATEIFSSEIVEVPPAREA
ncbi:MAG: hypothetical protein EHM87_07830 [Burkholderiales bacterium]|nr:MAG: hypothetical protein EHM87_07830 [Burkholderiales bacterium]